MDYLLICLLLAFPLILFIEMRLGSLAATHPQQSYTIVTPLTPQAAFACLLDFALDRGYSVDDIDSAQAEFVASDSANFVSLGFFYRFSVATNGQQETVVEVGITPKILYGGFAQNAAFARVLNGIRAALIVAQAKTFR